MKNENQILDMMNGKVEIKGEREAYIVEKLNAGRNELEQLMPQINKMKETLEGMAKRQLTLIEMQNQYVADLQAELAKREDEQVEDEQVEDKKTLAAVEAAE